MPGTVKLHRVLAAPPERVYKAFIDSAAKAKWLPPYGFTGTVHENDARVGGKYRMSFTNFSTGNGHAFGGTYIEMVPVGRHGAARRANRHSGCDPGGGLLPRLAGVARAAQACRRTRHPGLNAGR